MRIDVLAGTSNVVRFPVEERGRPTLDLMRMLAPDVRMIDLLCEAHGLEVPPADVRDRIDAEAAEHILNNVDAEPGERRRRQLHVVLDPVVVAAVEAARAARQAWAVVEGRRRHLAMAKRDGGFWIAQLEENLLQREQEAAEATIAAHLRVEEAEGVARAVCLARSGKVWTPHRTHADMDALLEMEIAARAAM